MSAVMLLACFQPHGPLARVMSNLLEKVAVLAHNVHRRDLLFRLDPIQPLLHLVRIERPGALTVRAVSNHDHLILLAYPPNLSKPPLLLPLELLLNLILLMEGIHFVL